MAPCPPPPESDADTYLMLRNSTSLCNDIRKRKRERTSPLHFLCAPPLSDQTFDRSGVSNNTIATSIASDRHIAATLESDKVPTNSTTAFTPLKLSEAVSSRDEEIAI